MDKKNNQLYVWLLTSGSGGDGDEWDVISIHKTKKGVWAAKKQYEKPRERADGSFYSFGSNIERWRMED